MASKVKSAAAFLEERNPISQLNDLHRGCDYNVTESEGQGPKKFYCRLTVEGKLFEGYGPTKKEAKISSAKNALQHPAVNINSNAYSSKPNSKNTYNRQQGNRPGNQSLQNKVGFIHAKSLGFGSRKAAQGESNLPKQYLHGKQVCRNFMSDQCYRGKNCTYYHPEFSSANRTFTKRLPTSTQIPAPDTYMWAQFCKNYLQMCCPLNDCKFLHVSRDDEAVFNATGNVPPHIVEQAFRKALVDDIAPPGVTQTCKAYLEGQCSWYSCPFRHLNRQEFSHELLDILHKQFNIKKKQMSSRVLQSDHYDAQTRLKESQMSARRGFGLAESQLGVRRDFETPVFESQFGNRREFGRLGPENLMPNREYDRTLPDNHFGDTDYERLMPEQHIVLTGREYGRHGPENHIPERDYGRRAIDVGYDRLGPENRSTNKRDYERRLLENGLMNREDYSKRSEETLVNGMQNLMVEKDLEVQREIENMKEEVKFLQEENQRLRESCQMTSVEHDRFANLGVSQARGLRGDLLMDKSLINSKVLNLREENDDIRRRLANIQPNKALGVKTRENNAPFNFDKLLKSGVNKRENEIYQHHLLGRPTHPKGQQVSNNKHVHNNKQVKGAFEVPAKKSGQIIMPTFQVGSVNEKNTPHSQKDISNKQQQKRQRSKQSKQNVPSQQQAKPQNNKSQKNKGKSVVNIATSTSEENKVKSSVTVEKGEKEKDVNPQEESDAQVPDAPKTKGKIESKEQRVKKSRVPASKAVSDSPHDSEASKDEQKEVSTEIEYMNKDGENAVEESEDTEENTCDRETGNSYQNEEKPTEKSSDNEGSDKEKELMEEKVADKEGNDGSNKEEEPMEEISCEKELKNTDKEKDQARQNGCSDTEEEEDEKPYGGKFEKWADAVDESY